MTTAQTTAMLGDAPLLGSAVPQFAEKPGVAPVIERFEMRPEDIARIMQRGKPLDLVFEAEGRRVVVRKLYPRAPVPASRPDLAALEVSDIRGAWERTHVARRYNARRRTGDRRIVQTDQLGNALVVDDISYHPATLNPPFTPHGRAWKAKEIVEDVLLSIRDQLPNDWRFEYKIGDLETSAPLEDVELDEPGDQALARVLRLIPGAAVKVIDGVVHVYSQLADEAPALSVLGPPIVGRGITIQSDYRYLRPAYVRVLFTREMEVRFDYNDPGSQGTSSRGVDDRFIENVLPLPDPDIQDYPPGTWVTFEKAFDLWGVNPLIGQKLSHEQVQKRWLNDEFMAALADNAQAIAESQGLTDLWLQRMAAVRRHYRQTYRINRRWVDRIIRLQPYRLAILDTENGTRAPAQCWQDFGVMYGARARRLGVQTGGRNLIGNNIKGYNADLASAKPSPIEVRVLDADQGIVHLFFNLDPYQTFERITPCALDGIPDAAINNAEMRPRFWAENRGGGSPVARLSDAHKAALLMSAVPATNSEQQFTVLHKYPGDVQALLPPGTLGEAKGPPWTVRIAPAVETARYAWKDSQAQVIEWAFGLAKREPLLIARALQELLLNGVNIDALANAAAAVIYAGFRDREIGRRGDFLNPDAHVEGAIGSVTHSVGLDGSPLTDVDLLAALPSRDLFSLLPLGVLQAIRRLVK